MSRVTNQLQDALDNGWSIQIYSRDRRLLCSLYPSHGWVFLGGMMVGFIVALIGLSGQIPTPSSPSMSAPMTAPLNLD
ncbi:MAG TPA: hypothetical protein ACFE0H_11100 [Elainellaceae cyanobacterium]